MKLVILINGKAPVVFATIKLMAEKAGSLTTGELLRLGKVEVSHPEKG